jgi:chromosomal replication initiator protein
MADVAESTNRFDRLIDTLRSRVTRRQFATWFRRVGLHAWNDDELIVEVPNLFYQEWLRSSFHDLIARAAEDVARRPTQVNYVVAANPLPAPAPEAEDELADVPSEEEPVPAEEHAPAPFAGSGPQDAPLRLNRLYTFDNFITGPSNNVAHASARGVAREPGRAYNPLFIHGPVGLGKTHLLHAICLEFIERCPRDRICFLSCEEFTNEFVHALRHNQLEEFRDRFRNVDLLVIDDIHFLKGKERTQEEFFHTFNRLYQSGRQIVLSSDAAPSEIPMLEERLVSRFHWGLVTNLDHPEMETRMAIVQHKAALHGIAVPNDVVEYIASSFRDNIRELEGALVSIRARASVTQRPVDITLAREALEGAVRSGQPAVTMDRIQEIVCAHYQVKTSDLRSKRRGRSVSEPRQIVMYVARTLTSLSLDEIGAHFGGRDHTTVLYAVRRVADRVRVDPPFAATVNRLVDRLGGPTVPP